MTYHRSTFRHVQRHRDSSQLEKTFPLLHLYLWWGRAGIWHCKEVKIFLDCIPWEPSDIRWHIPLVMINIDFLFCLHSEISKCGHPFSIEYTESKFLAVQDYFLFHFKRNLVDFSCSSRVYKGVSQWLKLGIINIPNTPGADSLSPSNLCSRDVITVPALQQASPESKQETEKSAQAVVQGNHFGQYSSCAS